MNLSKSDLHKLAGAIERSHMPNSDLKLDSEVSNQHDADQLISYQEKTRALQKRVFLPHRSPQHLFEWASSTILVGALVFPVMMGRPLASTGQQFLVNAGLHPQHLSVFMGFLGIVRIIVLAAHGRFGGWCPWVRSFTALIGAFVWCEFLVANALNLQSLTGTPISIPIYVGLTIGELIACTRAVLDARYLSDVR